MNIDELLNEIKRRAEAAGGQYKLAGELSITPSYLSDILNKRRDPSKSILEKLGFEAVVTYLRVGEGE